MSVKHGVLVAAALSVLPVAAMAQSMTPGYYIGGAGGANWVRDSDIKGGGISNKADFDNGWAALLSGGYAYGNGVRTELELGYRDNGVDKVSGAAGSGGDVRALSLMANVNYDFNTGTAITPYVGIGLGGARVDFGGVRPVGGSRVGDEDTVFAYQGLAGASYRLNDAVSLFSDYRYFATKDADLKTDSGVGVKGEYASHTVMLGLRYSFGAPKAAPAAETRPAPAPAAMVQAPPPPPPPAPAAAPPRNFLVFFDFDKATLTSQANGILAEAATAAKSGGATRIEATGHADRSGSDQHNVALSKKRVDAVKRELMRRGVPERDIVVTAKGESEPLVSTADGVREPQNRRVEIVFR
ncbi:MAG: OmpA family protein [Alphaproteobacteria bacterium]